MTLPQGAGGKGNVLATPCVLLLSAPAVNTNGELPTVTCLGGAYANPEQACDFEKQNWHIDGGQKLAQLLAKA